MSDKMNKFFILLCFGLLLGWPGYGCGAKTGNQDIESPAIWRRVSVEFEAVPFELNQSKGKLSAWGGRGYRWFFPELLPAVFERTLRLEKSAPDCAFEWIFTGERGGVTVVVKDGEVRLRQRYYDSFGFRELEKDIPTRHPESYFKDDKALVAGEFRTLAVRLDHKLGLSVEVNGRTVLRQKCLLDLSRHQLKLTEGQAGVKGQMLRPLPEPAVVRVDSKKRYQTMIGFGGITPPPSYAQLSPGGKRRWFELLCEYNLLIQREYPIGVRLNREMDNWDRLEDALQHYYGDNFPNGEITDFAYNRTIRQLGGMVWFEFWALPPWAKNDPEKYAEAMVNYCSASKRLSGAPPEIVGIQNEVAQSDSTFREMTLKLREALDREGFGGVRIHMSDDSSLKGGIKRIRQFRKFEQVWNTIDYAATHMYDYQQFLTDPDSYDSLMLQWKELTGGKPFLSTELCINNDSYQVPSYRVALSMGQLYHKNLVLTDAAAILYCWTIVDVEQPSYGWTRSLFVTDRTLGFIPVPGSHQLRVYGAYSRRIRQGMVRVAAVSEDKDLLVSAFDSAGDERTVVVLNRSSRPKRVSLVWPGARFDWLEVVDQYNQNDVRNAPAPDAEGPVKITVEPGAIVTLTSVPLGVLPAEIGESIH